MLAIMPSLIRISVETAEPHTTSCHLEITGCSARGRLYSFSPCNYTLLLLLHKHWIILDHPGMVELPTFLFTCARARSVLVAICVRYSLKMQYTSPSIYFSSLILKCLIYRQVGSHNHFRYRSISYPTICRKPQ